ncbi:VapE domain-containing protein [Petrimonas sp.]|uniref:VapE domain-containing protein n=1 Tax=Petrimonas sp. TaxID=2023866 RepID=UPI003F51907A
MKRDKAQYKDTQSGKQSKNERIETFLRGEFDFRFNIVKTRTEYREKGSEKPFSVLTKFDINSIRRILDSKGGIYTSPDNIRNILESNFAPKVNPIKEYFQNLPAYPSNDDTSPITELAKCVTVKNTNNWNGYLLKWLVAVVANAMDDTACKNHTCLVLTGRQGEYKTTFLDMLCPTGLQNYLFTGKIDPQNKDVQTLMAEFLLINIDDQLRALNKRDENELKNLITTPFVKYRRPYDIYIEEHPHRASFMASVNGNDFLTDSTGSRRFLPFEALYIDIDRMKDTDMDNVFSQAYHLYKSEFRYWFNKDEVMELNYSNNEFQMQTVEYEMLIKGFTEPDENGTQDCFYTTTEIVDYLQPFCSTRLVVKQMGEALRKSSFKRESRRVNGKPVWGYLLKQVIPVPF